MTRMPTLPTLPLLPTSTTNGLPEPSTSFDWRRAPWGDVLVCRALEGVASHFFTGRELQLRGGAEGARADWARVAQALGLAPDRLWRMRQVHGCDVFTVGAMGAIAKGDLDAPSPDLPADLPPQVDALVTNRSDVGLAVQVADCVPLLLADPRTGAVAATHAGWRGTAANVAGATVARLVRDYHVRPADLIAAIGPSIGPSCFQVGPEVRDDFVRVSRTSASASKSESESKPELETVRAPAPTQTQAHGTSLRPEAWFTPDEGDRLRLDIWRANHDQLVAAGVQPEQVHIAGLCTVTHVQHFFSYRREHQATGRMLGVIRSRSQDASR
jgi:YfiH family protein